MHAASRKRNGFPFATTVLVAVAVLSTAAAAQGTWYVSERSHFRISVPDGWQTQTDVNFENRKADVLLSRLGGGAEMVIESRPLKPQLIPWSAQGVLQGEYVWAGLPDLKVVVPPTDSVVGGHGAAYAVVAQWVGTYYVYSFLVVVLGPEWSLYWHMLASMTEMDLARDAPAINATVDSFQVIPPQDVGLGRVLLYWLLLIGLVATATEATVLAVLIRRGLRR